MKTDKIISELIGKEYKIYDLTSDENSDLFVDLIRNFKSKIAIVVSSNFFNENIGLLSNVRKTNYIKSIITLPPLKDSTDLILILLNSSKKSDKFILIDESNSLIHDDIDDFENINNNISKALNDFKSVDNAVFPIPKA